jgi:hypothetical protein
MSKLPFFATLVSLAILPFAGCNADLADGNPCRAIAHATCERVNSCNLFAPGGDLGTCLDGLKDSDFVKNCGASSDAARTCADDLDAASCGDTSAPPSCAAYFYNAAHPSSTTLLWPYDGGASTGAGGTSSAGTGGTSGKGGSGGSSGKGGSGNTTGGSGKGGSGGSGGSSGKSGTSGATAGSPGAAVRPTSGPSAFVGKWSGTVARQCSEDGMSCSGNTVFNLDITLGGRGIEIVMPGSYASTDPPGPSDCPAVTLTVSGTSASANDQVCSVASQGGTTYFTTFSLSLVTATELKVDVASKQQVNSANLYTQEYTGTLTLTGD